MSDLEKLNHNHEDGCDCGCHDHDDQMMTLVLEDDSELHCHVIGIFDALDRQYIALLPEGCLLYTSRKGNIIYPG